MMTCAFFLIFTHRVVLKKHRTPLILHKGEDGDDTDDHAAGNEDDEDEPGVHDGDDDVCQKRSKSSFTN